MLNEMVLADETNGRKSYDFGQRSLFVFHVMQVKLEDNLAEVRHGTAEFCDFDVEIGGSLLFTIGMFRKAM